VERADAFDTDLLVETLAAMKKGKQVDVSIAGSYLSTWTMTDDLNLACETVTALSAHASCLQ